jgi:hypothetical protein
MGLTSNNRLRQEIAQEAAKLVAIDGQEDYLQAKKKAAQMLGVNNKKMLPSNQEIEAALIEYQSLFQKEEQLLTLVELRQLAYKTMKLMEEYHPRLVGPVLTGTANQYSEIIIHVFSDTSEYISLFLENQGIPVSICERRLKIKKDTSAYFTAYKFIAGDIDIVLIVLPLTYLKNAPLDPITERPIRCANLSSVKTLIDKS